MAEIDTTRVYKDGFKCPTCTTQLFTVIIPELNFGAYGAEWEIKCIYCDARFQLTPSGVFEFLGYNDG